MTKEIKIGLFGFGCVGQGLFDVLNNSRNFHADIKKFVVKNKNKERSLAQEYFSYDQNDILEDPQINLITELIDDADAAYEIVKKALINKKNVVSANKKMIAEHLEELVGLQYETGASLLYEASACASIPIIRTLEEYYDNEMLHSVKGIFNGSSNYILTKMFEEGSSYDDALKEAQDLGFAETDPTLDVGGFDAKYKLVIITAHSYGVFTSPKEIFNYGIQQLSDFDMQFAREKGQKIKQVAKVFKKSDEEIAAYVIPQFISKKSDLFGVDYEYNGVIVEAAFTDKQFFRGKGAGGHPTGSAVLSDISANRYDYKYEYRKTNKNFSYKLTNDVEIDIYFRYNYADQFDRGRFIRIYERFESINKPNYVIGRVNLMTLISDPYFKMADTFIAEVAE